jgi:heavy metal sensor kinase
MPAEAGAVPTAEAGPAGSLGQLRRPSPSPPFPLSARFSRVPIRWRLTLWYAVLLAGAFAVFGGVLYVGLRVELYGSLDEQVEDLAALTLATVQEQGGELRLVADEPGDLENDEHFVRLTAVDGRVVVDTSEVLDGVALDPALLTTALAGATSLTSVRADGETFRVVTTPVVVNGETLGVLQVGMSREEIDEALRSLVLLLAATGPVVLAVAVAGGYLLAGRAMSPVDEITRLASSVGAEDLHARLNLPLPDDELGRLAATFNAMLARIEDAFERQRRFTGDAAHELRTPLSLMRSQVDVALLEPPSEADCQDVLRTLQGDLDRLAGLVGSLLTLARADAGELALAPLPCDLADLVEATIEQFAPPFEEAGVLLRNRATPCALIADADLLVQVLVNLIANALAHTPRGGTVEVGCRQAGEEAHLWVADTGEGIAPEHQARVFERFYRADPGRSRARGGAGLGLSISRTIVAAHGGRIDLTSELGRGTRVEVVLPLRPPAAAAVVTALGPDGGRPALPTRA